MDRARFPLWDLPVRVFHWSIACLVPLAWWTGENQNYDAHQWIGYAVIVLVLTRVLWGFFGSAHARFTDFLVGPGGVLAYLRGEEAGSPGHNPLGGWSVVVLLLTLLLQGVSGLFNSDDILFSGPLYYAADTGLRDAMGAIHEIGFNVLLGLIGLHLAAVCYHQFLRREPLIQAMFKGAAAGREGRAPAAPWWLALVVLGLVALALWWGLEQAPQPQPIAW
jgi:cytochrome b